MRKLIVKAGSAEQEYPITDNAIIGRSANSTIRLDFSKIEDTHAKISRAGANTFVEDLDTPHGITVNGKKVSRWALKKGDLLCVGTITLLYDEDNKPDPAPAAPPKPAAKTVKKEDVAAKKEDAPASLKSEKPAAPSPKQGSSTVISAAAKAAVDSLDKKASAPAKAPATAVKDDRTPRVGTLNTLEPSKPAGKSSHVMPAVKSPGPSVNGQNGQNGQNGHSAAGIQAARPGLGKSSPGLNAVSNSGVMPSARANPNNVSSPRLNAMSPSAKLSIGGGAGGGSGAASGVNPSVGNATGINRSIGSATGMNPAMSGRMPVPGSGGDSSHRLPTSGAAAMEIARRMANAEAQSALEGEAVTAPANKKLLVAVSLLSGVVVILLAILFFVWLRSGNRVSSEEKTVLDRLHSKGPKLSDDLSRAMPRLQAVRRVEDVTDILGEPDLKFKDSIPLWDPNTGTTPYPGPAFIAYYLKDREDGTAIEESPITSVFLFLVTDDRAEFMGPRKYSRIAAPPLKKPDPALSVGADIPPPPGPPPTAEAPNAPAPRP